MIRVGTRLKHVPALLLAGVALVIGAIPARAQVVQLTFNTLPSAQGWVYTTSGIPESSVFSVDGTALHQNTIGTGLGAGGSAFQYYILPNAVDPNLPFVLDVRARVTQSQFLDTGGFGFGVFTGTQTFEIFMNTSSIQDAFLGIIANIDNTVFHDYRLEATPFVGYNFFVDGSLVASGKPRIVSVPNQLFIGDATSGGNAKADVTLYRFTQLKPLISPDHGGNAGSVTVVISSNGIQSGAAVKLTGSGTDIVGTNTAVSNGSVITTTFDLIGAAPGTRNVVISNPDGTSTTLPSAFTVDQGGASQISVDILGRNQIRFGSPQTYYLVVSNTGNVDSDPGIVSLSLPSSVQYAQTSGNGLFVAGSTPTIFSPAPVADFAFTATPTSPGTNNLNLLFASSGLPPGSTQYAPVQLFDVGVSDFTVTAEWQQDQYPSTFEEYLEEHGIGYFSSLIVPTPAGCRPQRQTLTTANVQAGDDYSNFQSAHQAAVLDLAGIAVSVGVAGGEAKLVEAAGVGLSYLGKVSLAALSSEIDSCVRNYFGNPSNQGCLFNVKTDLGTAGAAANALLQNPKALNPTALKDLGDFFSAASVAVNEIDSVGTLNADVLAEKAAFNAFQESLSTYVKAFNSYETCVGGTSQPPTNTPGTITLTIAGVVSLDPNDKVGPRGAGAQHYFSSQAALTYSIDFGNVATATAPAQRVVITDQLDVAHDSLETLSLGPLTFGGQLISPPPLQTTFSTTVDLRPATNLLVGINASLNTSSGLLTWTFQSLDPSTNQPPTDPTAGFLPPGGGGSVFFTVRPNQGLATSTQIQNQATVVFDTNAPINTPIWTNTLDLTAPTSQVGALPALEHSLAFTVQWIGSDVGAGVQGFTIYVSEDGGPFTVWQQNTTATSATFTGQVGHSYGFYSIATDLVGNVEAPKSMAEATTKLVPVGDVNGDGVVNCADLAIVKASFGTKAGQPEFDPRADLNGDGVVNVLDLSIVAKQIPAGMTCQ